MSTLTPPPFDHDGAAAAAQRFASGAPADVRYAVLETPIGTLVGAQTPAGLVQLHYEDWNGGLDAILDRLAQRLSPRILHSRAALDPVARELDEYFSGRRTRFDIAIDWQLVPAFGQKILKATAAIPYGDQATYGDIASRAGSPGGARAAGNALGANPVPIIVPCHRVVRAGGVMGGYTGGVERKQALLALERGEQRLPI